MNIQQLEKVANTIRGLSLDAIEAANSGHPGLPLGCAELGAYLFGHGLSFYPSDPYWMGRDRFVLSAGHGSMLLYASLHLAGYDVSLEDLKQFRQLNYPAAGHPEYGDMPGIETTTGPLGQGIATAVGMALGQKMASAQLQLTGEDESLLHGWTVVLAGDGCMMEGVASEASSLAGHLGIDRLMVIYDSNDVCLDGYTQDCFTEDVVARYRAYGWEVFSVDGHDFVDIHSVYQRAKQGVGRPVLIVAKTQIGKGSPTYVGKNDCHGKALGAEEVARTKEQLGLPVSEMFYVSSEVRSFFQDRVASLKETYDQWQQRYDRWAERNPEHSLRWHQMVTKTKPDAFEDDLKALAIKPGMATRDSSGAVIQYLHQALPYLVGGSADLSSSDKTLIKSSACVARGDFSGRNIRYGVREFAMGAMATGLGLQGMAFPFCGTFLTFSDYMRNAIRLAALMKVPVVYQLTHDSIFLGEDGPTHQPVEHLAALRVIPGLTVIRPADSTEVKGAWAFALSHSGPVAMVLSRQKCPERDETRFEGVSRGAYVLKQEAAGQDVDYCLLATGSEVSLALDVSVALENKGYVVRVVSVPSFEQFDCQDSRYQESVMGGMVKQYCSIEAQTSFGWHRYIGKDGISISVDSFGKSAPAEDLADFFGFTVEAIVLKLTAVKAR